MLRGNRMLLDLPPVPPGYVEQPIHILVMNSTFAEFRKIIADLGGTLFLSMKQRA
jgi:hypothetical protein